MFLSYGGQKSTPITAKTANKTLLLSPSNNLFAGTSLVKGSQANYEAGNASPTVFHEISAATSEHSVILGTLFTTPDLVLPAPLPTTFSFPAPAVGASGDAYIARSAFANTFADGSDSYYSATIDLEIGLKNIASFTPTFTFDVSALGLTENTDYTIESQSKATFYSSDYATSYGPATIASTLNMTFDPSLGYTWAFFHFYIELTVLEGTTAPTNKSIANCHLDLTALDLAWSC